MKNSLLLIIICCVLLLKLIVFTLFQQDSIQLFNGGDANYYHSYAIGNSSVAANVWPLMLRELNSYGLYSREIVSLILFLTSAIVTPLIICKTSMLSIQTTDKLYFYMFLWLSLYPTLFFFSLDVVRDAFMVFVFSISLYLTKIYLLNNRLLYNIYNFIILCALSYLLFLLRPYLGVSFITALLITALFKKINKPKMLMVLYLLVVFGCSYLGFFDVIINYREGFNSGGGSTLNINLSNTSSFMFIPLFLYSYLAQFFGLYYSGMSSVFVFVFESIFIIYSFYYLITNSRYFNEFVIFLIIFTIIYNTIWIIGNDNLGTAVRLRMYSYISLIIAAALTFRLKKSEKVIYKK